MNTTPPISSWLLVKNEQGVLKQYGWRGGSVGRAYDSTFEPRLRQEHKKMFVRVKNVVLTRCRPWSCTHVKDWSCSPCQSSVDYGNTMHRFIINCSGLSLGKATRSFPWENFPLGQQSVQNTNKANKNTGVFTSKARLEQMKELRVFQIRVKWMNRHVRVFLEAWAEQTKSDCRLMSVGFSLFLVFGRGIIVVFLISEG